MRELDHLLPDLEPPPGGLARLQHSLRGRRTRTRPRVLHWLPATAGACAMILLVSLWLPGVVQRQQRTAALTRALREAMALPANGIRVINGAVLALPSGQANVRIYLVQTNPPPAAKH